MGTCYQSTVRYCVYQSTHPPPRYPMGAGCLRLVCSLPGLNRSPQRQVAIPSGILIPVHRPHGTRFHSLNTQVPAGRCSLPQTSPPAYRRFQVTGDAEPPGLVPIYHCAQVNKGFLPVNRFSYPDIPFHKIPSWNENLSTNSFQPFVAEFLDGILIIFIKDVECGYRVTSGC